MGCRRGTEGGWWWCGVRLLRQGSGGKPVAPLGGTRPGVRAAEQIEERRIDVCAVPAGRYRFGRNRSALRRAGRLEHTDAAVTRCGGERRIQRGLVRLAGFRVVERTRTVTVRCGWTSGRGSRRGGAAHTIALPVSSFGPYGVQPVMPVPPGS
ncbi:hypothetical protein GCM10029963_52000 [Micromonospora andamanensis]